MSTFVDSQSQRLCAAVDKYAQKLGYLEGPTKDPDGETIPGDSVEVEMFGTRPTCWLTFSADDREVTVAVTEITVELGDADHTIMPCGGHLDNLVAKTARAVVHALFDPE